ncbi:MAG: DEAD/DEAH box helicase, partial [Thermoprotei archaeon]
RAKLWKTAKIVFATPQAVRNDIVYGFVPLKEVCLIIFDEAHRAVGDYPYVFIAERYMSEALYPLILALTASPGSSRQHIKQVCSSLFISQVEVRDEESPDVKPYVNPINLEWKHIDLPPLFRGIRYALLSLLRDLLKLLKEHGLLESAKTNKLRKKTLLELQSKIQELPLSSIEKKELSLSAVMALRVVHAMELLETQGLPSLANYFSKFKSSSKLSMKALANEPRWVEAENLCIQGLQRGEVHPKLAALVAEIRKQLEKSRESRIIVFTNLRSTAKVLEGEIRKVEGARVAKLVGKTDKEGERGLSQAQQVEILSSFKSGFFNVLVSTQVAEEGVDVVNCDLVIFYDNVPSAIRFIQRVGRTGRIRAGRVVFLITKGTRDEAFYWSAIHKRREMRREIRELMRESAVLNKESESGEQLELVKFMTPASPQVEFGRPTVFVDHREMTSKVVEALTKLNINVKPRALHIADYVVSESVAVERKTVEDFANSIIDKRLFTQLKNLKEAYSSPILLIEGEGLTVKRMMPPEALRGALVSIAVDYGIPIIWSKDHEESAHIIALAAKREQLELKRHVSLKDRKMPKTLAEQQEYIVASLPNIDVTLAKRLLGVFGTVENVFTASEQALQKVSGIGPKKAQLIRKILTAKYEPTSLTSSAFQAGQARGKDASLL